MKKVHGEIGGKYVEQLLIKEAQTIPISKQKQVIALHYANILP